MKVTNTVQKILLEKLRSWKPTIHTKHYAGYMCAVVALCEALEELDGSWDRINFMYDLQEGKNDER